MASRFSDQQFYSPPEQPPRGAASPPSRPQTSISPWSSSSLSLDQDYLTLPPLLGTFDDETLMFQRERQSTSNLHSERRIAPPPQSSSAPAMFESRRQADVYDLFDSSDPFFNFEDPAFISTTHSPGPQDLGVVDLTSSPGNMAPSLKRKSHSTDATLPQSKRQQVRTADRASAGSPGRNIEEIDLSGVDNDQQFENYKRQQQEELIRQQNQDRADKPVRLADFQCIICLDNPTDLTVTHCGHLFCSLCLHEALHAGTQKSNCPVCRTLINTTKKVSRNGDSTLKQPKNGVFALEMKLMTARRKEKMPAKIR